MILSSKQKAVCRAMRRVKFEGGLALCNAPGGTGKSACSLEFRREYRHTVVLAPTGLAAINVGGMSIDRFFGWRPGNTAPKKLSDYKKNLLIRSGMLDIDEVSMVSSLKFDRMNRDLQLTFENAEPFGGIGIFLRGDIFQLPPVIKESGPEWIHYLSQNYKSPFFFDAGSFLPDEYLSLDEIFRQAGDVDFQTALNQLRIGEAECLQFLNERSFQMPAKNAMVLTYTNRVADAHNSSAVLMLKGEERCYHAEVTGGLRDYEMPSPRELVLKVGSRVMATANGRFDEPTQEFEPYVNGDLGVVIKLTEHSVVVEFDRGFEWEMTPYQWRCGEILKDEQGELFEREYSDIHPSVYQIPLRLAYASTVHKSQGQTFHGPVHLDIPEDGFEPGLAYVACSRCTSVTNLSISRRLTNRDLMKSKRVHQFHQEHYGSAVAA